MAGHLMCDEIKVKSGVAWNTMPEQMVSFCERLESMWGTTPSCFKTRQGNDASDRFLSDDPKIWSHSRRHDHAQHDVPPRRQRWRVAEWQSESERQESCVQVKARQRLPL